LSAAHFAYANGEIFGKTGSKYLWPWHLFGDYVVDLL
jgi:hypothetical protein